MVLIWTRFQQPSDIQARCEQCFDQPATHIFRSRSKPTKNFLAGEWSYRVLCPDDAEAFRDGTGRDIEVELYPIEALPSLLETDPHIPERFKDAAKERG